MESTKGRLLQEGTGKHLLGLTKVHLPVEKMSKLRWKALLHQLVESTTEKKGPSSQGKHQGSASPGLLALKKPGPSSEPEGGKHDKASSSGRHGRRSSAGSHRHERALASGNTGQAPSSSSSSGNKKVHLLSSFIIIINTKNYWK